MRKLATLKAEIWVDDDWRSLSHSAQWLYEFLLSQPRLTLAGQLDLMPARWAACARGVTEDDITRWLGELDDAGFVVVDWVTGELVIRSFTKHDFVVGRVNKNLTAGLWSAWKAILSVHLRAVVVSNLPEWLWIKVEAAAPDAAKEMRGTSSQVKPQVGERLEPEQDTRSEPQVGSRSQPPSTADRCPLPADRLPLPADVTLATVSVPASPTPVDNGSAAAAAPRIARAAERAAERKAMRLGNKGGGWIVAAARGMLTDNAGSALAALRSRPDITDDELTDLFDPPGNGATRTTPADAQRAAAERLYELNRQRHENPCPYCDGGWIDHTEGVAPCPECDGTGVARTTNGARP